MNISVWIGPGETLLTRRLCLEFGCHRGVSCFGLDSTEIGLTRPFGLISHSKRGAFLWLLRPGDRDLTVKGVTVRAVDAISELK